MLTWAEFQQEVIELQGVFINYRRDDTSGYARLLYERLVREFGEDQIFMDVEALREPGMDFVEALEGSVGSCVALLALIGKNWLTSEDRQGRRRLDVPEDFVRAEIAAALGRDTRVIPILVQGARMPEADELPDDLAPLARRQALKLSHDDWEHHVDKLIVALEKLPGCRRRTTAIAGQSGVTKAQTSVAPGKSVARSVGIAVAATLAVTIGVLYWIGSTIDEPDPDTNWTADTNDPQSLISTTPVPPAESSAGRGSNTSTAELQWLQESLAALGYAPGPADGVMGQGTTGAIREFQNDAGLAATGMVTPQLLTLVADAVLGQLDADIAGSDSSSGANLNGTWYDENSIPVYIEHIGTTVRVGEFNVMMQQFMPIGSGTFQNGRLELQYTNSFGQSGTVSAQLAADGQHLNGTDTTMGTNYAAPNIWHYEHLPGQ